MSAARPCRVYLDHNATMPLRPEAKAAMVDAMEVAGNPSSVHAEGRAAKALIERARGRIAEGLGALDADIVFVSGATEGAALACAGRGLLGSAVEHDAVGAWVSGDLPVDRSGKVTISDPAQSVLQFANSETGILQSLPEGLAVVDFTQAVGKIPIAFSWTGAAVGLISAHKFGGPKGIGALLIRRGLDLPAQIRGGGQEMGRRSGTENVIGISGMAAALDAALEELERGHWHQIAQFRNILEKALGTKNSRTIFVGKSEERLPNTSCILTPGWKGETQVMQMDLAGFAVSAGSACSSGKVRVSRVLTAMGYDETAAASAIRVSLGATTTEDDVLRFAETWQRAHDKHEARGR